MKTEDVFQFNIRGGEKKKILQGFKGEGVRNISRIFRIKAGERRFFWSFDQKQIIIQTFFNDFRFFLREWEFSLLPSGVY